MPGHRLAEAARFDRHVGTRIRQRRQTLDMSQETLGELLGVSYQMVQKYEKGKSSIHLHTLHALAEALRTTEEYFYGGLYEGFADPPKNDPADVIAEFGAAQGGHEVATSYLAMRVEARSIYRTLGELLVDAPAAVAEA